MPVFGGIYIFEIQKFKIETFNSKLSIFSKHTIRAPQRSCLNFWYHHPRNENRNWVVSILFDLLAPLFSLPITTRRPGRPFSSLSHRMRSVSVSDIQSCLFWLTRSSSSCSPPVSDPPVRSAASATGIKRPSSNCRLSSSRSSLNCRCMTGPTSRHPSRERWPSRP